MTTTKIEEPKPVSYYLVFMLGDKPFALPLEAVQRVVHAVEVTRLPKAPDIVCGLVNYKGTILPIFNISGRFHLPEQEIEPHQHFIILQVGKKRFGLVADSVSGVVEESGENLVPPTDIVPGVEFLAGVLKLDTGLMLIPDLEKLLTPEEETALKEAVKKNKSPKINPSKKNGPK